MKFVYTEHLNNGIMYKLLKILLTFCTHFVPFSKLKFHQPWLNGPTLLEQQVSSMRVDIDSDKLLKIEEKTY